MTTEQYVEQISKEPSAEMISEFKNDAGETEYRYIKKSILQRELLQLYEGNTQWDMQRETVTQREMFGKGVLMVRHPVSLEWLTYSGTASLPREKALRLDYPSLEAHCFSNACKKIGVWFGQTLNSDIEDAMPANQPVKNVSEKLKPDMRILKTFHEAVQNKNQEMIDSLTSIYQLNQDNYAS